MAKHSDVRVGEGRGQPGAINERYGGTGADGTPVADAEFEPDWDDPCQVCKGVPTVPISGMCGPCTFGEADTHGGNW